MSHVRHRRDAADDAVYAKTENVDLYEALMNEFGDKAASAMVRLERC